MSDYHDAEAGGCPHCNDRVRALEARVKELEAGGAAYWAGLLEKSASWKARAEKAEEAEGMSDEKEIAIAHNWQGRAIPLDVLREVAALEAQCEKQMARFEKAEAALAVVSQESLAWQTHLVQAHSCTHVVVELPRRAAGRESGDDKDRKREGRVPEAIAAAKSAARSGGE